MKCWLQNNELRLQMLQQVKLLLLCVLADQLFIKSYRNLRLPAKLFHFFQSWFNGLFNRMNIELGQLLQFIKRIVQLKSTVGIQPDGNIFAEISFADIVEHITFTV